MNTKIKDPANAQCRAYSKDEPALNEEESDQYLNQIDNTWILAADGLSISRTYKFKNYYETMAFVNTAAMIAHQQDLHPDITVTYNTCHIKYSTHSVGGLSENDFICAAKTNKMLSI